MVDLLLHIKKWIFNKFAGSPESQLIEWYESFVGIGGRERVNYPK